MFSAALETLCRDRFGAGHLAGLQRLSGGASMESWRFVWGGEALILRRLPPGLQASDATVDSARISLSDQADLIALAGRHAVQVPAVRARLTAADGLGEGFIMACAPGEALPQILLRDPVYRRALDGLATQWAEQLAAIHRLPVDALPDGIARTTAAQLLVDLEARWHALGGTSPVFALAFGWLERAVPAPVTPALCHGDFRMGNLLITPDGLSAVLDWELAHLGDPVQDLAFGCTPSWRFGHYDLPLGGFARAENLLEHYAAITGTPVDPARFRFWLVYACLWWGVCCLTMADIWRQSDDASPERLVIGRRVSEVEIDLLLMLGDDLPAPIHAFALPNCAIAADTGVPAGHALIDAVRAWLDQRVISASSGHARFEAKVAANALQMAARDAALGTRFADAQAQRLAHLRLDESELNALLRSGPGTVIPAIHDHLRQLAVENCSIDQPHYAGLRKASEIWSV